MNNIIKIFVVFFIVSNIQAQNRDTLNQDVSPIGGINNLAVKYYGIDFTKNQRLLLKDKEIEFIFQVDEKGIPTLSEINGTNNKAIIDSLQNKTKEIQNFHPSIRNGVPVPSIYFMQLVFPTYKMTKSRFGLLQGSAYNAAKIEDFEYINYGKTRFDMVIGGVANQFIGKPAKHLKFGGGMRFDINFTDKRNLIYGLSTSFYGNKLKKDYPINTNREQFTAPPTGLVGITFGKWFNNFNLQSEFNLAVQNITEKIGDNDEDWIQLKGWSPGLVVNYPIRIGKKNSMYYYGAPVILENNINLHLGLRYIFLSIPEASGFMFEIGLCYRMAIKEVEKYKLKDEFLSE